MRRLVALGLAAAIAGLTASALGGAGQPRQEQSAVRPLALLRPWKVNPRYFTDGSGRAVYLTGSHHWESLVDNHHGNFWRCKPAGPPLPYIPFINRLARLGHNFMRMWAWSVFRYGDRCRLTYDVAQQPWLRTGPGAALDGRPRFDLRRFDPAYFRRLRQRVLAARKRRIYVSVMLFEGFVVHWSTSASPGHPFNARNNVNGIDADRNRDGFVREVHTLENRAVTRIQEAYVRKVIDTLGDLDNVLWEIANETGGYSTAWQYHMIDVVKRHESRRRKRHPVGMTFQQHGGTNEGLLRSRADWISPSSRAFLEDPPAADGRKVSIPDTDHHCGVCGDGMLIWKAFVRGHNTLYMDPLGPLPGYPHDAPEARRAMGDTRRYADRLPLARMKPRGDLTSTRYALAWPGRNVVVLQPEHKPFTVDLGGGRAPWRLLWHDVRTGMTKRGPAVRGRRVVLTPPFERGAVAFLARIRS